MAIIRRKKTRDFTVVSNAPFQRCDMSAEAKGMLIYLLTLPHDWSVNMADLETRHKDCKRDKTRRVMSELMEFGYVVRETRRDPATGQMSGWDYVVDDEPQLPREQEEEPADLLKTRRSVSSTVGQTVPTKYTEKQTTQENRKAKVDSLREIDAPPETPPTRNGEAPPSSGGSKPRSKEPDYNLFFDMWNSIAIHLPRITDRGRRGNANVKKKIKALVKDLGSEEEALSVFIDACREVNQDEFWQQKRLNIENLMRHVTVKADNWVARQTQKPKKAHDGIENDPLKDWFLRESDK